MSNIYLYPMVSGGPDCFIALSMLLEKQSDFQAVRPVFVDRSYEGKGHNALEKERDANKKILSELKSRFSTPFEEIIELKIPFEWYIKPKTEGYDVFPWARNLVFISAVASKIAIDFQKTGRLHKDEGIIVTGFHKGDGRDADNYFVKSCNKTLQCVLEQWEQCQSGGKQLIRIAAPLIQASYYKSGAVNWAFKKDLKFILEHSWSCYTGDKKPCGECTGCKEREYAFKQATITDPSI